MDTNVGDMPIDIFGDYVSDILGEEWTWEYFALGINGNGNVGHNSSGDGIRYPNNYGISTEHFTYFRTEKVFFGNGTGRYHYHSPSDMAIVRDYMFGVRFIPGNS